jgi:peptidoglycan/LPS O-acetylase OafA/YrhL
MLIGAKPLFLGVCMEALGIFLGLQEGWGIAVNDIFNAVGFFLLAVNLNNFLSQNLFLKKILALAGDHSLPVFLLHAPLIPLVYYSFKNAGMNVVLMLLITYLALVSVAALFFDRIFLYGNPLTKKYFGATPQ